MDLSRWRRASIDGVVALLLATVLVPAHTARAQPEIASPLRWSELPPLPDPIGFAGPFAGVSRDALIVAGGANFPDGRPWDGHPKVWHDRIFVLDAPEGDWRVATTRLPRPSAYGVALTWNDRVVCIGGGDATEHHDACFMLRYAEHDVIVEPLPSLPTPTAFFCGALLDDVVYVMGGIDRPDAVECLHRILALDLAAPDHERAWVEVEPWPGPERYLAVAGAQDGHIYVMGGIRLTASDDGTPTRVAPFLRDGYRFTPSAADGRGNWARIADLPHPIAASPTPALALGAAHLLVLGGDDGSLAGGALRDAHPGFSNEALAYSTLR